ncbi:MAG: GntP family permease [Planctomycetes bacterium]|nr:GntP family permease [Planctomycetota bacterium]
MVTAMVLVAFLITIGIMILFISKYKIHPAISILLAVMFLGIVLSFVPGIQPFSIVRTINTGFANTIRDIALVIFLGCVLGKVLEETGAAVSITKAIVRLLGPNKVIWAIAFSSAILGIPIFADSVVILLIPIVSVMAATTGASMMAYGGALYCGALVTASLVPPTPGPVAAAALLHLPLGQAVMWGIIVSVPSVIGGVIYLKTLNKFPVEPKEEYITAAKTAEGRDLPSTTKSLIPILIPIVLIMLNTMVQANFDKESVLVKICSFIGDPLPALLIGCLFSIMLIRGNWMDKKVVNGWVEYACRDAAMPLIVTGLGGSLALFVRNADIANQIANAVAGASLPGIFLPIIIAALIHVITGSNALGVMTAAALVEPMLETIGVSPLAAFLACGTGALMFKHSNSSGFWVTTSMSNMSLTQGLRSVGGFSTVCGFVGAAFTVLLHYLKMI